MPLRTLNLALALTLAVTPALAVADSTMTTKTVPTCAAGDPLVIVNTQTKYYSMMPKPMPSPGTQVQATNSKVMCRSKAQAMGAKLRGQPAAEQNQGGMAPAMKPATMSTAGNTGATAAPTGNSNAGNGNSGPMTGTSPAPAGTANAGTPPPGPPSHSP